MRVWGIAILGAACFGLACGGGDSQDEKAEAAAAAEAVPIGGLYEVEGSTIALETGAKRRISGKIILADQGNRYTATFNLATTFPDPANNEPLPAEVIGRGEGVIEGRTLRGTTETQLVVAAVPGVDPNFAFVPLGMVSKRITSTANATVAADGSVTIELENKPAPGERDYAPTRTNLRGRRVSAAGLGGADARAKAEAEAEAEAE